jgi:hypothetical protein
MANKRYIIRLSETIGGWFEMRAKATGQSVNAVMSLALTEYLEQKKGIDAMSQMVEQLKVGQKAVDGRAPSSGVNVAPKP